MAKVQSIAGVHSGGYDFHDVSTQHTPSKCGGQFRIVREKRGDLITGFRVQVEKYGRNPSTAYERGPYWANIGRKAYTVEAARDYRAHLERHHNENRGAVEYEEIV
jgi:hypothetical protein